MYAATSLPGALEKEKSSSGTLLNIQKSLPIMHAFLREPLLEARVHGVQLFLSVGLDCGGILFISLYFISCGRHLWFLKISLLSPSAILL